MMSTRHAATVALGTNQRVMKREVVLCDLVNQVYDEFYEEQIAIASIRWCFVNSKTSRKKGGD